MECAISPIQNKIEDEEEEEKIYILMFSPLFYVENKQYLM